MSEAKESTSQKRKPRGPYLQYFRNNDPIPKRSKLYWDKQYNTAQHKKDDHGHNSENESSQTIEDLDGQFYSPEQDHCSSPPLTADNHGDNDPNSIENTDEITCNNIKIDNNSIICDACCEEIDDENIAVQSEEVMMNDVLDKINDTELNYGCEKFLEEHDPALVDSDIEESSENDDFDVNCDDLDDENDEDDENCQNESFIPKIIDAAGCNNDTPVFKGSKLTLAVSIMLIMTFVMR